MIRALPIRPVLLAAVLVATLALLAIAEPGTTSAQTVTTLVSNTGQSGAFTTNLSTHDASQAFRTGANPHGYVLTSVGLRIGDIGTGSVSYTVGIYTASITGLPNQLVATLTAPSSVTRDSVNEWTHSGLYLAPNTDYVVFIDGSGSSQPDHVQITESNNEDSGGADGWSIDDVSRRRGHTQAAWTRQSSSLKVQIGGYARTETPLVSNLDGGGSFGANLNARDFAQAFRTGANPHGYMLTRIGFPLLAINASISYTVSVYTDLGTGQPNQLVATLTPPASLTGELKTWTSSRGVYLAPNTSYVILFDSSSPAGNTLSVISSTSEDRGGTAGWSIGDIYHQRARGGGAWSPSLSSQAIKLRIDGHALSFSTPNPPTTPVVNSDPASPTTLSLSWRAPDTAVNLPITSYDVQYRVQGSTGAWTSGPQDRTVLNASLTGPTEGTAYEVQVRATDARGDSAWSASGYGTAGAQASGFVLGNTLRANEFVTNPIVSTHDVFQPFTTGSSADGYRITSVDLLFLHVADGGATPPNVGIYVDRGSGLPGDRIGALFTRPTRLVGANDGVNTWTSPGIDLQPGTTYLLGVIGAGSAAHIVRNSRSVNQDPGGLEGWSLGNSQNWRTRGTSSYAPIAKSLKLRLSGHTVGDSQPDAGKLITNTGQTRTTPRRLDTRDSAQAFTTGGNPHGYTLTSVTFEFPQVVNTSESYTVSIYTAGSFREPNQLVATLTPPASLNQVSVSQRNTWTSPGIYLAPNTEYTVFLDSSGASDNRIAMTGSHNEDAGGAPGWSIHNQSTTRNKIGGNWSISGSVMALEITGFARDRSDPNPPTTPLVNSNPDSPTTLTATWRRPDVPVNLTVSYDLRYRVRGTTTWSQGPQDRTTASGTITGLTDGTHYEVQVRAGVGSEHSIWSASGYGTAGGEGSGVIIGNTGQANEFSDNTNLLTHDVFQPFTTGTSHEGYRITNLEIMFLHVEAGRRGTVPQLAIYEERSPGSGLPGALVGILTSPARLVAGNDGLNLWTSPGIDLDPSTTYLLAVDSTGNAPHVVRNTTSSNADGGALSGWSIVFGNNKRSVGTSTYNPVFKSLKTRIYGYTQRGSSPVFGQRSYSRTVDENSAGGVNVGAPVTATDADGDTLTYSLGGRDAASFNVNAGTGQITTRDGVTYDHEGKNTFRLTITATDGITPVTVNLTIQLNNINEPGDNPCGPDPIEARTFAGWETDDEGRYVVEEEGPGVYRGTLQERCFNGGHRTNTRYHLYEFTLTEMTKVMIVLESDLQEHRTVVERGVRYIDPVTGMPGSSERAVYTYSEWFDPYLILLRNDGTTRTVVTENDDIEHISGTSHVKHATAAIIRTLAAGTYTVYATSYPQGASGSFRLFYFHEDSDDDPVLVFPERRAELGEYTDYSFIKRRFSKEYGDEHAPMDVAVSDTGLVTWEINSELLQDGESFGVKWWKRTAPAGDNYRNAEVGWAAFQLVNVSACSGDDCSFQIPNFDPDFHYPVEINLADWYYSPRVKADYTPSWRVRISETGEVSWTADSDPPDGQHYWVRWQSGETAPNYVEFDFNHPLFGYTQIDHTSSSCGTDGVCRVQISDFDPELHWLAEVWPQRSNPTAIRWPGRWPAPEGADEPEAPALSGLSAAEIDQDGTLLDISWSAFENADKYLVQWKTGDGSYNEGVERTTTSYRITGLTARTTYTVQVSAIDTDADPEETLASSEVQGATWSELVRFGSATYELSIAENTAGGADVGDPLTTLGAVGNVTYTLSGTDGGSFTITAAGQIQTRSGVDYDYESNSTYTMTVTATDSAESATTSVTITLTDVDEPPRALDAPDVSSASTTSLRVSWNAPDNSGRPPVSDYDVQYRAGTSGAWSTWAHDGTSTSTIITGLSTGTEYQVQVLARNDEGSSRWSVPATGTPGLLVRNTGQQTTETRSLGSWDLAVPFTTGADAGGYTLNGIGFGFQTIGDVNASYQVQIYTDSGNRPNALVGTLTRTGSLVVNAVNRWSHDGLNLDVSTTYWAVLDSSSVGTSWVRGTNSDNEDTGAAEGWSIGNDSLIHQRSRTGAGSDWQLRTFSFQIEVIGGPKAAGAPPRRGLSQASGLDNFSVRPISGQVSKLYANWDPVTGATYYKVRWKTGAGAYGDASVTATAGFQIDGLTAGSTYTVEVQAMDTGSDPHRTLARGEARGTTLPVMGTVTVAPVTGSDDSLDVSWAAVALAAGYKVEWKTGGGEYTTVTRSDVTATTERVTGLISGTTYSIRVTARHDIEGTVSDGDSAEASATTSGEAPVFFVIYHDPDAGTVSVNRYNQAVALLTGASIAYTEVTGDVQDDVNRLAGVTGSVLPRFFLGDPTGSDWTSVPRTNNGGLRWLRAKVTELQAEETDELAALVGLGALASPGKTTELLASWSAFAGAEQYRVEQKVGTDPATAFVLSSAGTTISRNAFITGLLAGTTYTIRVTAIDTDANPDADVAVAEVTATTLPAMGTVTVTPVTDSSDSLDVSWNAVTGATGYVVEYKAGTDSYTSVTRSDATAITERITGLEAETTYTVRVTARHIIVGSTVADGDSAEASATTNAEEQDSPPGGTTSQPPAANTPASGAPTISGTAQVGQELTADTSGISDADGLTGASFTYQWLADGSDISGATGSGYTPVAGDVGKSISVRVSFTDDDGNAETLTSAATAAVVAEDPPAGPAALDGLAVSPVAGETTELAVSWTAFSGADKYLVQWKTGEGDYNTGDESTGASHTITGLTAGAAYAVQVTAIDTDADPAEELARGEAGGATLPAMGIVTVEAVSDTTDSLDISWDAVSGATGYVVEYKTSGGSYQSVTRSDATATTERIAGLDAETEYTVRVTARHTIGGAAADGDSAQGTGSTNAPPAGTGTTETTDEKAPALKAVFTVVGAGTSYAWDAMDTVGGNAVTHYSIEWATSLDGPWTTLNAPGEGRRCVPRMAARDEGNGCYFEYEAAVSPSGITVGDTYFLRLIAHAGSVSSAPGAVLEDVLN